MKEQNIETRTISIKDRDRIVNCVECLSNVTSLGDYTTRIAASLAIRAQLDATDQLNTVDLKEEADDFTLILDLFRVISEVSVKNEGILYFPKATVLTEDEKLDLESKRIQSRVVDLLGDQKDMKEHRENLKRVFSNTKDEKMLKTWKAVDAQLEAEILFSQSLLIQ